MKLEDISSSLTPAWFAANATWNLFHYLRRRGLIFMTGRRSIGTTNCRGQSQNAPLKDPGSHSNPIGFIVRLVSPARVRAKNGGLAVGSAARL